MMNPPPRRPPPPLWPLSCARLARLPCSGLPALAALRARPDIRVGVAGETAWISWDPADSARDEVVEALLPVPGAVFFRQGEEDGRWYRIGSRLPDLDARFPVNLDDDGEFPLRAEAGAAPALPLHRVLVPGPIRWEPPSGAWEPVRLRLERDDRPRPASALLATAGALLPWAESAPTARLGALRAARSGDRVLVFGRRLPPIPGAGRLWGHRVLIPLGMRAEPALPEPRLAEALGLADDQLALIGPDARIERLPSRVLVPLSRQAARRMAGISPADRLANGSADDPGGRA
ncbi:hypothetical protein [Tautonia sociabilis]|uniref:MoxR-vWA-beta-propeller ternary system domain-containing protein n=1 Tax=Tautonia sociabilis TaxID=2080755 RepID=A0A432MGQ1_9BACT|nr:hypothetical protein [Tautonia sociabilis]RUL85747.1 hypothetical protein TsocGM_17920 [Tautonia sociabilis]